MHELLRLTRVATFSTCLAWATTWAGADGRTAETPASDPSPSSSYLSLRYDADTDSLAGTSAIRQDGPLDEYKNVQLDDNWTMSLGGMIRYRFESETNKAFGLTEPAHDAFHLFRYLLNADFKYQDALRIYVELIGAFDEDRDLALRGIDENRWDIQHLFIETNLDFMGHDWTVRVGRQGLIYGNQRLVSTFNWANVQRRFDGVKMFTGNDTWDFDMWWTRPVLVQREQNDTFNEDVQFWGAYATYKGIENHGLDLYFFALLDDGVSANPNGSLGSGGDRNIYTLGTRYWGTNGAWDYETELAGPWGHWSGDSVQAWSWSVDAGYSLADVECEPRLGFGFDMATGDRSPTDSSVQTFTQLFPLGHEYFGYLDLIGRQNITSANVNVSAWAVKDKSRATLALHSFRLTRDKDALYGAGGGPVLRDPLGDSGREIGYELDATLTWKLDDASNMLFGWSHLWDNEFIQSTTPGQDADLFYVQYVYRF